MRTRYSKRYDGQWTRSVCSTAVNTHFDVRAYNKIETFYEASKPIPSWDVRDARPRALSGARLDHVGGKRSGASVRGGHGESIRTATSETSFRLASRYLQSLIPINDNSS
jgi:hypothetical protein